MSSAETDGRYKEAVLPDGVPPQKIISSSGTCTATGEGRISMGCGILREASVPGLGPSIQAMLRCASLSEVAAVAPAGTGVSSKRISAIRHWCGPG
jgi:hypothetical protein